MHTNISNERERVSTGVVLSQVRHIRQQPQLGRQAALEIVIVHAAAPPAQPPPLSDTWTRISQVRGSSCQQVRCSHKFVSAVINPSSVGSVPSTLLPSTLLDHDHSPPPLSDTWTRTSQLRGNACQRARCSHKNVILVIKPSSVGSVPGNPKLKKLLSPSPSSHHHVNNPGV